MENQNSVTYAEAGVDIVEGARAVDAIKDTVHSTYRPEVVGDIGGFGGLFSIAAAKDMADPLLVSGTDGVGTKLKVAQRLGVHDTVGIDLVAMCVNDILATGAEPLFFLDYVAVGKLDSGAMAKIVGGIGEGCRQSGCALIGGEMAEQMCIRDRPRSSMPLAPMTAAPSCRPPWWNRRLRAIDRKSTRLNSSHSRASRMPSSA